MHLQSVLIILSFVDHASMGEDSLHAMLFCWQSRPSTAEVNAITSEAVGMICMLLAYEACICQQPCSSRSKGGCVWCDEGFQSKLRSYSAPTLQHLCILCCLTSFVAHARMTHKHVSENRMVSLCCCICSLLLQPDQDWLALIDFLQPPKRAALAYLDGSGPKLQRYGRVTIVRGTHDPPVCMDYQVMPLAQPSHTVKVSRGPRSRCRCSDHRHVSPSIQHCSTAAGRLLQVGPV